MARINSNISSLIAQANLRQANGDLDMRLERLATGLRINRGKDDPAGLIISERLSTDIAGIEQAMKNGERASMMIATTEASLSEINELLNSIKALMVEAANTGANSREEREANQLQIDSAIDSITRISNTASFGGLKLLDGSLDYITSGVDRTEIVQSRITAASLIGQASVNVEVDVVASAQRGQLFLSGDNAGVNPDGVILSATTLRITGPDGVQELTFTSGTSLSSVVSAVNAITQRTGVQASLINGDPNSERLPIFHQLDIRLDKRWVYKAWTLSAFLEVLNAYNRGNVEGFNYNFDFTRRDEVQSLPIIPNIGVEARF